MLVECIPKNRLAFHILPFDNPKAQRTLQAANLNVKRLWCQDIKRLILDNYEKAIPEKAKQMVLKVMDADRKNEQPNNVSIGARPKRTKPDGITAKPSNHHAIRHRRSRRTTITGNSELH